MPLGSLGVWPDHCSTLTQGRVNGVPFTKQKRPLFFINFFKLIFIYFVGEVKNLQQTKGDIRSCL